MRCNRCSRDLGEHYQVDPEKQHFCWACADTTNSPTVQRAEDLANGLEVAKLTEFEQPTVHFKSPEDAGHVAEAFKGLRGEREALAESIVKVRDIAMDARLRTEFLIDYLSDSPHVKAFEAAASIDGVLGEIVRETSRAIGPYLPETPDFRKGGE